MNISSSSPESENVAFNNFSFGKYFKNIFLGVVFLSFLSGCSKNVNETYSPCDIKSPEVYSITKAFADRLNDIIGGVTLKRNTNGVYSIVPKEKYINGQPYSIGINEGYLPGILEEFDDLKNISIIDFGNKSNGNVISDTSSYRIDFSPQEIKICKK